MQSQIDTGPQFRPLLALTWIGLGTNGAPTTRTGTSSTRRAGAAAGDFAVKLAAQTGLLLLTEIPEIPMSLAGTDQAISNIIFGASELRAPT